MKKIDTSKWKEFLIGDLFDIHPTKAYKKINIELFEEECEPSYCKHWV